MPGDGQFCPIAQAAEVLTERWTPLVLRELALTGSRRFNDIQRGVPLVFSSLLSKRLRQLERAGIVERGQRPDGKGSEYHLTRAGEELGPVLAQIGLWSERWLRRPIFEETPDTGLLMVGANQPSRPTRYPPATRALLPEVVRIAPLVRRRRPSRQPAENHGIASELPRPARRVVCCSTWSGIWIPSSPAQSMLPSRRSRWTTAR